MVFDLNSLAHSLSFSLSLDAGSDGRHSQNTRSFRYACMICSMNLISMRLIYWRWCARPEFYWSCQSPLIWNWMQLERHFASIFFGKWLLICCWRPINAKWHEKQLSSQLVSSLMLGWRIKRLIQIEKCAFNPHKWIHFLFFYDKCVIHSWNEWHQSISSNRREEYKTSSFLWYQLGMTVIGIIKKNEKIKFIFYSTHTFLCHTI